MYKVRIFVDCHVFDGTFQGTTSYLQGLYTELIKDNTKQFFLAAVDIANLKSVFGEHPNVQYLKYSSANKFLRLLINIPFLLKKYRIDYAHFQYIIPPVKLCKYIDTIHDVLFLDFPQYFPKSYQFKNRHLFQWSANHSDVVLTVSEYSRERISHHFKISKISITPNAVEPVFFEKYDKTAISEEVLTKYGIANYWIFISRHEPRKNRLLLLRAFAESDYHNNFSLVFVGRMAIPDPEYDNYFRLLPDKVKGKILNLESLKSFEMLKLIRAASLSIYPSFAEGFGIPPLESAAARIPTVCSNTTAMADFTFMENCLFDPSDINDLLEKIKIALADKDLIRKQIAISENYSWSISAKRFLEALELI
ncbi:MAG TPA: glycosyltransferase family 1 protein [Flavobacterium sp.]|jgi:hypothetical protein